MPSKIENREQVCRNERMRDIPSDIINGDGIVITERHYVKGNNGGHHWFQLREKYCHNGIIRQMGRCNDCDKDSPLRLQTYYQVEIFGEIFLVNKDMCVEYNQPIDNAVANKTKYESMLQPDIHYPEGNDYVKQTEEITGMKVTTGQDYDHSLDVLLEREITSKTIRKDTGTNAD